MDHFLHLSSCVGHGWDCLSVGDFISGSKAKPAVVRPPLTVAEESGLNRPSTSGERPP